MVFVLLLNWRMVQGGSFWEELGVIDIGRRVLHCSVGINLWDHIDYWVGHLAYMRPAKTHDPFHFGVYGLVFTDDHVLP